MTDYREIPAGWPGVDDLELPPLGSTLPAVPCERCAGYSDEELQRAYIETVESGWNTPLMDHYGAEIEHRHPSSDGIPDRLKEPGALRSGAVWYAARGVPVFPLSPGSKIPRKDSAGFKDASTDTEQVWEWWTRDPAANIGAATGHRFDVIDVDGPEAWPAIPLDLPTIGRARTVRPGGWHLFVPPSGAGNRAHVGKYPFDVRGLGGYVLLPPSRVGARFYHWIDPLELT